jgi:hypothetical protein
MKLNNQKYGFQQNTNINLCQAILDYLLTGKISTQIKWLYTVHCYFYQNLLFSFTYFNKI